MRSKYLRRALLSIRRKAARKVGFNWCEAFARMKHWADSEVARVAAPAAIEDSFRGLAIT